MCSVRTRPRNTPAEGACEELAKEPSKEQRVPLDRAQTYRQEGVQRIQLDEIGFWPENRGGSSISGHHVHEVAEDCVKNVHTDVLVAKNMRGSELEASQQSPRPPLAGYPPSPAEACKDEQSDAGHGL